jgi:hypothetical protein
MTAESIRGVLPTLFSELVFGSTDTRVQTFMLNRGDEGLLASLERLSAAAASRSSEGGGSIAAHADHLRYGLRLLNRWAAGTPVPRREIDWTASWRKDVVSDDEWRALRDDLRREAEAWLEALRTPRDLRDLEAGWLTGSIPHVAYHVGAIRQIDRTTRGPTAEDEANARAAQRTSQRG